MTMLGKPRPHEADGYNDLCGWQNAKELYLCSPRELSTYPHYFQLPL